MAQLGEYALVCRLDQGSGAPWFAARRRERPVLLRILDPKPETWWATFRRELADASRVLHPSHLTLLDAGDRAGRPFLTYEPAFGLTLADAAPEGGLPGGVAAAMALQLLDGLSHAHAAQIAMGPLGAERVLASFDGRFLWVDAGLASTSPALPGGRAAVAPESSGAGRGGRAADLYALGRILSAAGPALDPRQSDATADWFAALAPLLASHPRERSVERARAQLERLADADGASRFLRDRHRRVSARLSAALERDELDLSTDLPPVRLQATRGIGPLAGSLEATTVGAYTLEQRLSIASPLGLYRAHRDGVACWLRLGPDDDAGPSKHDAFRRESQLAKTLSHAGLPAAQDVGPRHIAYERRPGRPLSDWIQGRAEAPLSRRRVVARLAELLEVLHDRGLVAGNLQATAVFVLDDKGVQLVDRGFITSPNALDPWLEDNPHALAPEYFSSRRHDFASDRFALGVLMYQLWTGTRPYRGLTRDEIAEALERGRPRPLRSLVSTVDPAIADLVDALLDPEPEARPSLARILRTVTPADAAAR